MVATSPADARLILKSKDGIFLFEHFSTLKLTLNHEVHSGTDSIWVVCFCVLEICGWVCVCACACVLWE